MGRRTSKRIDIKKSRHPDLSRLRVFVHDDQLQVIVAALARARAESASEWDAVALTNICLAYVIGVVVESLPPDYEGYYQVSDTGEVCSLDRIVPDANARCGGRRLKGRVLKQRHEKKVLLSFRHPGPGGHR